MKINLSKFPYENIREIQEIVLNKLKNADDKYRYIIMELPTGSGKSAIAKTIASSYDDAFLITATKQLQNQYISDFDDGEIESIMGKTNYTCTYNDRLNCEIGPCTTNNQLLDDCIESGSCPYYSQRNKTLTSKIALTSYSYSLRAFGYSKLWKPRDILILDECHLLESQVVNWAGFFLHPRQLNLEYNLLEDIPFDQFLFLTTPPSEQGYDKNKKWLESIWDVIVRRRLELYNEVEKSFGDKNPDELTEDELTELISSNKDYYDIDKLYKKFFAFFNSENKESWLIEPENDGLSISPINIGNLFKSFMDKWAKEKVIFMSATILDIAGYCEELNLPRDQTAVIKIESTFDPKKSPILYNPVGYMNYRNIEKTIPKIKNEVENILSLHPNEKGVIHTSNYRIAEAICEIKNNRLMMKNENENNEDLVQRHILSPEPTVLVSPSLISGTDLKDELSRFQIIVKLPFLSIANKRVQKKMAQNSIWYTVEMFKSLLQACGRSTRSDDDWSKTYVLDSSFYKWVYKYRKLLPKYFHKRIIWKKDDL